MKEQKDNSTSWFVWAAVFYTYGVYSLVDGVRQYPEQGDLALISRSVGIFLFPTLLLISGIRVHQGKVAYFWRMLAVSLTALFGLFVLT